jgi:hypothetical protein
MGMRPANPVGVWSGVDGACTRPQRLRECGGCRYADAAARVSSPVIEGACCRSVLRGDALVAVVEANRIFRWVNGICDVHWTSSPPTIIASGITRVLRTN